MTTRTYKSSLLLIIRVGADDHAEAKREVAKIRQQIIETLPVGATASDAERRVSRV